MRVFLPVLLLLLVTGTPGLAEEDDDTAPGAGAAVAWFPNVAADVGLQGVRAKGCCFVRLTTNGGPLDLCLDRQHFYRKTDKGYVAHTDHGIPYPVIKHVPILEGKADLTKAKERAFVPKYLYFADIDNDGDNDAIYGVHENWMVLKTDRDTFKRDWRRIEEADPGVRSTVYLNDGAGHFTVGPTSDFTLDADAGPAMALAIVDVDRDGCLDLFEGREYQQYGSLYGCGVDRLWLGDGAARFADATVMAGLWTTPEPGSSRPTYGVTHADWNNDGWQDLMALSYGRQRNRLWKNNGDGTFTDVGSETHFAGDAIRHGRYPDWVKERQPGRQDERPFRANGNTFDCAIGDVDGDGTLDAFLGEIAHRWAGDSSDLPSLLRNEGEAKDWAFRRETVVDFLPPRTFRIQDWNYADLHTALADFDCDGRMDLLIGSGDYPDGQFLRLYLQRADGTFREATEEAGFNWEGCGAISLGDYDNDGDLDILAGRSLMRLNQKHRDRFLGGIKTNDVALFENRVPNRGASLVIRLIGKGKGFSNTQGIGARVTVHAGKRRWIREVRCGAGLSNHQDATDLHFGLGEVKKVDRIEIRWPRAADATQFIRNVAVNQALTIHEGNDEIEAAPFR